MDATKATEYIQIQMRLQKGFDPIVSHVLLPAWRGGKCVRLHPENARDFKLIDFCAQGGNK